MFSPYFKDEETGINKPFKISGRVTVKETGFSIPDVIVQAYWVDLDAICGKERHWFEYLGRNKIVCCAGADSTTLDGTFTIMYNQAESYGQRTGIGLIVLPPDDGDQADSVEPLYKIPVPKFIADSETFLLRIPDKRVRSADLLPSSPPTSIEWLEHGEKRDQKIAEWLKNDRKQRDKKVNEFFLKAEKAFEKFRPSSVPKSVREQDNYLEDTKNLKEALVKVRSKTLNQLKVGKITKKRHVELPIESITKLGFSDEVNEMELSFSEVTAILKSAKSSGEFAIRSAIRTAEDRQLQEKKIAEELYQHYIKKNY